MKANGVQIGVIVYPGAIVCLAFKLAPHRRLPQSWAIKTSTVMLPRLLLALLVAIPCIGGAQESLPKNWRWLAWRELAPFTYDLPDPDAVELHLFESPASGIAEERDPLKIKIADTKRFTGIEARRIAQIWRNQDFGISYSAACHDPAYAMTVYRRGQKVFFASICFACHNIYFYGGKVDSTGIDSKDRAYKSLEKLFTDIWPKS